MKKKLSIRNLKVKNKLLLFSVVVLAIIVIVAGAGIWATSYTNDAQSLRYESYGNRKLAISDTYTYFNQVKIDVRNMMYIYDGEDQQDKREASVESIELQFEKIQEQYDLFDVYLDEYPQTVQDSYADLKVAMTGFKESIDKINTSIRNHDLEGAEATLTSETMSYANDAQAALDIMTTDLLTASSENSARIRKQMSTIIIALIVVCVISFILVIAFCISITKQIVTPVAKLSEASKKLALGDVDVECHKINDDDLGELMEEFEQMAEAIKKQTQTTEIVSRGDLTVNITPRSDRDVLGMALQRLVADDNLTLGNIKEGSMQVTVGAEQVANASQSLAQGSTEQASALQQVTASMAEIADKTKANASQANEADDLVRDVKGRAAEGNDQMKNMIEAMNDINQSSEMISKIIKTIDDISFQTNILALNAAVEAARAGVHGKGFAVVAEEVRNLAAKSASAASETAEMIEDTIQKVGNGARIAEETGKSLDEIVTAIDKIVELIGNIAVASNDQATAVSQIDQAISQVSTVVQTNSATSQQCAAASEELSNQAANLRKLLGHFKLAGGNNALPGSSHMMSGGGLPQNDQPTDFYGSEPVLSLEGDFGKY